MSAILGNLSFYQENIFTDIYTEPWQSFLPCPCAPAENPARTLCLWISRQKMIWFWHLRPFSGPIGAEPQMKIFPQH